MRSRAWAALALVGLALGFADESPWAGLAVMNGAGVYNCCDHSALGDMRPGLKELVTDALAGKAHLREVLEEQCRSYADDVQREARCQQDYLEQEITPWVQAHCKVECLNPGVCAGHWPHLDYDDCEPRCPDGHVLHLPAGHDSGAGHAGAMMRRRLQGAGSAQSLRASLVAKGPNPWECAAGHHLTWHNCSACGGSGPCPPPEPPSIMLQKHCHAPLACGAAPTGHDGLSVCDDGAEWAMCGEGANHCCCVGVCDDVVPTPAPTGSDLCHDKPIDMAFVIDSSDSIEPIDFETVKHAVGDIITGLEIAPTKIQIAAHAFSCLSCHEHPEAGFGLTEHYGAARVALAIDALPHHMSSTYMGTAMEHTIEKVMTPSAGLRNTGNPPVIIIITDGNPTGRQGVVAAEQAAAARAAGFKIFAIGVGGKANDAQLQAMASTPYEDHVYQLDTFDVSVFKNQLLDTVCSQASTTSAVAALPTALQGRENQL